MTTEPVVLPCHACDQTGNRVTRHPDGTTTMLDPSRSAARCRCCDGSGDHLYPCNQHDRDELEALVLTWSWPPQVSEHPYGTDGLGPRRA